MAGLPVLDADVSVLDSAIESGFSRPPTLLGRMPPCKGKASRDVMPPSDFVFCKMPGTERWAERQSSAAITGTRQYFKRFSDAPLFPLEEWDLLEELMGEFVEVPDAASPKQDEESLRTILDYAKHLYKQKHGSDMCVAHGIETKLQCSNGLRAETSSYDSSNDQARHTPEGNSHKPQGLQFCPWPAAIEIPRQVGRFLIRQVAGDFCSATRS